jgi:hypothetical protein
MRKAGCGATDAFNQRPLSRASRPFIADDLKRQLRVEGGRPYRVHLSSELAVNSTSAQVAFVDIFLRPAENHDIFLLFSKSTALCDDTVGEEQRRRLETFCIQLETRVDFFYFFARNPLKSPDSDE